VYKLALLMEHDMNKDIETLRKAAKLIETVFPTNAWRMPVIKELRAISDRMERQSKAEPDWQQRCLDIGFEYTRAPDDHYVTGTLEQARNLLRDVLGVDVHITHPPADARDACEWKQDEHSEWGEWNTSCGNAFCLEEGTPPDNGMKFCCYCGAAIAAKEGK
jgi:hypothetical protein